MDAVEAGESYHGTRDGVAERDDAGKFAERVRTLVLTMVTYAVFTGHGAAGYVVALLALFGLPETKGRELA